MKRRYFNPVQLHGQCKINIDTGHGISQSTIPKLNFNRQNNADVLIDTVLHFAIMRHGTDRLLEIVNAKIANYDVKYKEQGLFPDDQPSVEVQP